ncbi:MAG: hypothetical protein FJW23_14660 [Acidimicrobiia bacterium]|nr:hypothetical protein [Acidimicrobiia bacterium]
MADTGTQSFDNHARIVPAYHYFTFFLLVAYALWAIYRVVTDFSVDRVMALVAAVALVMIFFFARVFALKVQDRVIRLEMRLRLERLLPEDLRPRIGELTIDQLCALRFASDGELGDLTRRVLTGGIADRKAIKKLVQAWEADHLRA